MEWFLQTMKWGAIIVIELLCLVFTSLLMYRIYLKNATKIETANGISSLEEIRLGGLKQWIFIRGEERNNPVLLVLHGGPGATVGCMPSSRTLDTKLIKHFTVVHWDQRGAGKSYSKDIPIDLMTFDRLVSDCKELIDYLQNKLNRQKVFLLGYSAGSITGIKTAHKYPEKIQAYVGVSQYINDYERSKIWCDFIAEEAEKSGDVKIQNAIKGRGALSNDTNTWEKHNEQSGYLFRYGGVLHQQKIQQLGTLLLSILTSPEYSLSEAFRAVTNKDYYFSKAAMWEELKNVKIPQDIQSIQVPIYFFEGKYDKAAPTVLVENFYQHLDAKKGKKLFMFENSAHFLMTEEKEKYQDLLVNVVLKESEDK